MATETAPATCRLEVGGMDCADCAATVASSLRMLPGVASADVRFMQGIADITYDPAQVDRAAMARRIGALGYTVAPPVPSSVLPVSSGVSPDGWTFDITGMDCGDCAKTVQAIVQRLPGVREARVNFAGGTLAVLPEGDARISPDAVVRAVAQAGYGATVRGASEALAASPPHVAWWQERRVRELVVALALWVTGFALEHAGISAAAWGALYLAAIAVSGYPIMRAAWYAVRARRADMNVLMTVAAFGAVAIGQWDEGASVLLLFSVGTMLQALTVARTRNALAGLLALTPADAAVLHGEHEQRVPVGQIAVGDTVRVRPGERVAVDGMVSAGVSAVDQSPITGESVPVAMQPGSSVYAGSINGDGTLDICVTKPATDTALARIVALVEEAQASRAPAQAFVDRFAAVYTPVVIGAAALLAVVPPLLVGDWHGWVYRALVLLVVACPCALVISTPVALVAAIGGAAQRGVLFKGGAALEALAAVRVVAFDKTGTLTTGRPAVVAVHSCEATDETDVLRVAAALETGSEHPLARAIVAAARGRGIALPAVVGFTASPGRGGGGTVEGGAASVGSVRWFTERGLWSAAGHDPYLAEGNGVVCVERGGAMIGLITLRDAVRPESAQTVSALRSLVGRVAMLTGDNAHTASLIAQAAGVADVRADLLPADKVTAVRELSAHGAVAMVGDGVNDAPALATAAVGVAMGAAGSDVAIEAADVALMGDDLGKLPYAIRLARGTVGIIRQNVVVALVSKAIFLALTFAGVTNLWLAVFADMGISLLVTANALRVLRVRDNEEHVEEHDARPALAQA